jgi:hypothetical protein
MHHQLLSVMAVGVDAVVSSKVMSGIGVKSSQRSLTKVGLNPAPYNTTFPRRQILLGDLQFCEMLSSFSFLQAFLPFSSKPFDLKLI